MLEKSWGRSEIFFEIFKFQTSLQSNVLRVSSLESHYLCQNSEVAVTDWPRSGSELPGQLKTTFPVRMAMQLIRKCWLGWISAFQVKCWCHIEGLGDDLNFSLLAASFVNFSLWKIHPASRMKLMILLKDPSLSLFPSLHYVAIL